MVQKAVDTERADLSVASEVNLAVKSKRCAAEIKSRSEKMSEASGWGASRTTDLPVILILGPPGCGKGTLCDRLATDFHLQHLSVGDWLRAQTRPPIVGVPNHINAFVATGVEVPKQVIKAEYGKLENGPAPLILYDCSKRNISTLESMKVDLMPALKDEIALLPRQTPAGGWCSWRDQPKAVLLDNLMSTLAHAKAAAETFGSAFPTIAITVECSDETAEQRSSREAAETMTQRGSDAGSQDIGQEAQT